MIEWQICTAFTQVHSKRNINGMKTSFTFHCVKKSYHFDSYMAFISEQYFHFSYKKFFVRFLKAFKIVSSGHGFLLYHTRVVYGAYTSFGFVLPPLCSGQIMF